MQPYRSATLLIFLKNTTQQLKLTRIWSQAPSRVAALDLADFDLPVPGRGRLREGERQRRRVRRHVAHVDVD